MGRNRRMEYELICRLYENNYNTVFLGELLQTPNGHISKVLRGEDVLTRPRGVQVVPIDFEDFDAELQILLMSDADLFSRFRMLSGYTDDIRMALESVPLEDVVEEEEKEWKDMSLVEKGEVITGYRENGLSTRRIAEIVGVSQSTVVKTNNRYLYGTDTKPKELV